MFQELKQPFLTKRFGFYLYFLSAQAGAINSIAFLASGRFVSHLTGYATYAGEEIILSNWLLALATLVIPGAYLSGAMISAWFIEKRLLALANLPRYDILLLLVSLLFLVSLLTGFYGWYGPFGGVNSEKILYFLIPLAVACGIQNGLFTVRRGVVIRTTHLTGTTTDLATNIVRVLAGLNSDPYEKKVENRLIILRSLSILFFILGATMATQLSLMIGFLALLLPIASSIIILLMTLIFMKQQSR